MPALQIWHFRQTELISRYIWIYLHVFLLIRGTEKCPIFLFTGNGSNFICTNIYINQQVKAISNIVNDYDGIILDFIHAFSEHLSVKPATVRFISFSATWEKMSGTEKNVEKLPLGKNVIIEYTRCDCRKNGSPILYYHSGSKCHIKPLKSNTLFQSTKYDFRFSKK